MIARENPFRVGRVLGLRFRPGPGGWEALSARLESLGGRAALVGPHGSGKTTALEDLAERLGACRWIRLNEEAREVPPGALAGLGPGETLLVDGAEQLGRAAWRRVAAAARRLVVTTHRPGRLPTLLETRTTPALLEGLLDELLGEEAPGWRAAARALYRRHAGDLREVFRGLYDAAAAEVAGGSGSEKSRGVPAARLSNTAWLLKRPAGRS